MYNWETKDPYMTAWIRLRQACDALLRVTEIELGKQNTTLAQMDILLILSTSKVPLSPSELSAYVFREKHSVSSLLSRMQRAGYVRKVRGKKDQRVVRIQIQPKGREILNKSVPIIFGYARDLLKARFSKQEVKQLDRLMKALRDVSLRELGSEAKRFPATIEWEPEPMDQWRPLVKEYHARDTGIRKVGALPK
jgi:DNA-binding MarR family transcriptional regulator